MSKCPNCFYEFYSWNECVAINNILECPECEEHFELKAVSLNQPQLTIPKSVADYSEKLEQHANPQNKNWKKFLPTEQEEQEHWAWLRKDNNKHIYQAYLAAKALGVELVKVVEG